MHVRPVGTRPGLRQTVARHSPEIARGAALCVAVAALGWLAMRTHQPGHDWGDDFALYVRQARSLVEGNPAQVAADNRFAIASSSWHTFSPEVYPWGWPMLMAPVVMLAGVDYDALKALVVALWCASLLLLHLVVRPRAGAAAAWVVMVAVGVSWPMVVWTNSVVSDIPYLAVVLATLWWLDRCRARRAWSPATAAGWLVVLGLLAALAFSIRREGIVLLLAVATVDMVRLVRAPAVWRSTWRRSAVPYAVFAGVVGVLQLLLPGPLLASYPGTGTANISGHLSWYRDVLAQLIGLQDPRDAEITWLGSHSLALAALAVVLALALVGLVARCVVSPETDLPLAAYAAGHAWIVGISPFQEGRYLFPLVPLVLYFAVQAAPSVAVLVRRGRPLTARRRAVATAPCLVLIGLLAVSSFSSTWWWSDQATALRGAGIAMPGPTDPSAVEMFTAVRTMTRPDDVVAFFRARAMAMATERRSLQSSGIETILANADWYVMQRGSTYSQPLISLDEADTLGFDKVWSNDEWILYRVS